MYSPNLRMSRNWEAVIAATTPYASSKTEKGVPLHAYRAVRHNSGDKRLKGKKRLARCYNLRDAQLRRYVERARAVKRRSPQALQQILESRLDNVVRRLRWARSIWQARQMVSKGHFLVNGRKVDLPSFRVKPGDTIAVNADSRPVVEKSVAVGRRTGFRVPDWLSADRDQLEGRVLHLPKFEEVLKPAEADYMTIMEFYRRWLTA
jgi:small subunit ribosomal protein S4